MINQKLRRQVFYSIVTALWGGAIKTALASGQNVENTVLEAETGIFGGLQTTDFLVCMLIVICIILVLLIIMIYIACQKCASKKKVNFEEKKIERLELELQEFRSSVQQFHQQLEDKLGIIGAGMQAKVEAKRQELPVRNETQAASSKMVGANRKVEAAHEITHQSRSLALFLENYNSLSSMNLSGFEDKKVRMEFIAKYKIKAFSCVNYDERMRQPNVDPVFLDAETTAGGKYWAMKLANQELYYVVPNPKGTYESQLHGTGGMKEAFRSNYQEGSYEHIEALQPAEFSYLNGHWNILKPGKIRLS